MTTAQILKRLESLGDPARVAFNEKRGAKGEQFGVKTGDLRKVAKELKADHALALELWATKNLDAQMLAVLVCSPKELSKRELGAWVKGAKYAWLADWLNSYVVAKHPDREELRVKWLEAKDAMHARAAWHLTGQRVQKDADGLDLDGLLDRIEAELGDAKPATQWTMNACLAHIGAHHAKHRKRAIAIGEMHGLYRDYPVSKGCTSPFAPEWIAATAK